MKRLSGLVSLCVLALTALSCGDAQLEEAPSTPATSLTTTPLGASVTAEAWRDALLLLRKAQRLEAAERVLAKGAPVPKDAEAASLAHGLWLLAGDAEHRVALRALSQRAPLAKRLLEADAEGRLESALMGRLSGRVISEVKALVQGDGVESRAYRVRLETLTKSRVQGFADELSEVTRRGDVALDLQTPEMVQTHVFDGRLTWDPVATLSGGGGYAQIGWEDEKSRLVAPEQLEAPLNQAFHDALRAAMQKELNRGPIYVEHDAQGRILALWPRTDLSPELLRRLLTVLDVMNVAWPHSEGAPGAWESLEWDGTGQYRVRYAREASTPELWTLSKERLSYASVAQAATPSAQTLGSPDAVQTEGSLTIQWSPIERAVKAVEGTLGLSVKTERQGTQAQVSVHIASVPRGEISSQIKGLSDLEASLSDHRRVSLDGRLQDGLRAQEHSYRHRALHPEEQAIMAEDLDEVLEQAEPMLVYDQPPKAAIAGLQRALSRIVRAHPPEGLRLFREHLRSEGYDGRLVALMGRAALREGGAAGQDFASEIVLSSAVHPQLKSALLYELGMQSVLTPAAEAALFELVRQPNPSVHLRLLSEQAAHLVATQVRKEGDKAQYERGVALLVTELAKTGEVWRLRQLLGGLQNAGSPRTLTLIEPYLNHSHPWVQVAAFRALRLNRSAEATDVFLDALIDRWPSWKVRTDVVHLFREMALTADHLPRVAAYLEREPKRTLIADALTALSAHGAFTRALIEPYLDDPREHLRKAAAQALKGVTR